MDYLHSFCQPICQIVQTLRKIVPNFYGLPRKPELYSPTNCNFFSWPVPLNSFSQRSCLLLMMKVGCCSVALIANDLIEKPPALAWMNRIKDLWVMELQMHHAHLKTFSFSNIIHENELLLDWIFLWKFCKILFFFALFTAAVFQFGNVITSKF